MQQDGGPPQYATRLPTRVPGPVSASVRTGVPGDRGLSALPSLAVPGHRRDMETHPGSVLPLDLSDPRVQALIRHRTRRTVHRRQVAVRAAGAAARAVIVTGPSPR